MNRPNKPPVIGVLVDWLENEYQSGVLAGVEQAAQEHGLELLCFVGGMVRSAQMVGSERNLVFELAGPACVDGLVIMSGALVNLVGAGKLSRYCERYRPLPMCSIGVPLRSIPSILVENARGMRDALVHLIEGHGRRRIAFVRGPGVNEEAENRYRVYREVLAERGLPLDLELNTMGDFQHGAGLEAVRTLLDERRVKFDAVAAASDAMALGAIEALEKRGFKVPEQVAVVGFDDLEGARFAQVPLTTVRQPLAEQGRLAVETVLAQMRGEPVAPTVTLGAELVRRRSCGCFKEPKPVTLGIDAPAGGQLSLAERLERDQGALATRLAQDLPEQSFGGLVIALARGVVVDDDTSFLRQFDDMLRRTAADDPLRWHGVLDVLERYLEHGAAAGAELGRARRLLAQARFAIGEFAERLQARKRLLDERYLQALRKAGDAIGSVVDVRGLVDVLNAQLPKLSIPSAYLALFDGEDHQWARLVFASDDKRARGGQLADLQGELFLAEQLLPRRALPETRGVPLAVQPLSSDGQRHGYLVLEMNGVPGVVYETLRDQLSGALRTISVFERMLSESARLEAAERQLDLQELDVAVRLQSSVLPHDFVVEGLDVAAALLPSGSVQGAFYEVLPLEVGCWLAVGEAGGHGPVAAATAIMTQGALGALLRLNPSLLPSQALQMLDRTAGETAVQRLGQAEGARIALAYYEPSGRLVLASAGQAGLVCRQATGDCEVVGRNADEGVARGPGDVLVLLSDGVVSAKDRQGAGFGMERLAFALAEARDRPAAAIRDHLIDAVRNHSLDPQSDLALMVGRYGG